MRKFSRIVVLFALSNRVVAQTASVDSIVRLNVAGQWQAALTLARARLAGSQSLSERCALQADMLTALTRMGRYDEGMDRLATYDAECPANANEVGALRRELTLAPLPATGVDFSGIDAFWRVVDTLTADVEPSEPLWHSMFATPGYRLSLSNVQPLRADMESAFRPSGHASRDSLMNRTDDQATRLAHLVDASNHREELRGFRRSLATSSPIAPAVAAAAKFLPPGAAQTGAPPLVAFAIFRPDAYATGATTVVVDLFHVYENGMMPLLAHEFHHAYLRRITLVPRVPNDSADGQLVNAIINLRNEGIADLIDKPYPVSFASPRMSAYAMQYNAAYAKTPAILHAIDSLVANASRDSGSLRAVGRGVAGLLFSAGHPNGAYMARTIYETFGVDSLYPGVMNPFAFLRTYAAAAAKRGSSPPFSAATIALFDAEERKHAPLSNRTKGQPQRGEWR